MSHELILLTGDLEGIGCTAGFAASRSGVRPGGVEQSLIRLGVLPIAHTGTGFEPLTVRMVSFPQR